MSLTHYTQKEIELFLRHAIQLSENHMNSNDGGPFGAVVVKGHQIIGEGWNEVTSACDPTAHAEVSAIRKACKQLNDYKLEGCVIFTSCEPCPMCLAAIYWARIDQIYFANTRQDAAKIGFDDEFLYKEIHLPLDKRSIPTHQHLHEEALKVFKLWEEKEDKILY